MESLLPIAQIIVSILLAASILIQQRGSGLSAAFGGDGNVYRTKRGFEKGIYYATIILVIVFITLAVLNIII